jgi:hypothetical protein
MQQDVAKVKCLSAIHLSAQSTLCLMQGMVWTASNR